MVATTAVAMITATVLLGAPPWTTVIIAPAGTAIIVFRGACYDLGIFGQRSTDEPETVPPSAAANPPASTPPSTHPPAHTAF
jgi:hypothetical protein